MSIRFETKLLKIGSWTILRLPESASAKLPSRGQTMVGIMNELHFQTPLEPDGKWSHWFRVDHNLLKGANAAAGDTVSVSIEPVKEWPEPEVPADTKKALETDPQAHDLWVKITPMARWEWVRWTRATNSQERGHDGLKPESQNSRPANEDHAAGIATCAPNLLYRKMECFLSRRKQ